jgi:hypothetical protein
LQTLNRIESLFASMETVLNKKGDLNDKDKKGLHETFIHIVDNNSQLTEEQIGDKIKKALSKPKEDITEFTASLAIETTIELAKHKNATDEQKREAEQLSIPENFNKVKEAMASTLSQETNVDGLQKGGADDKYAFYNFFFAGGSNNIFDRHYALNYDANSPVPSEVKNAIEEAFPEISYENKTNLGTLIFQKVVLNFLKTDKSIRNEFINNLRGGLGKDTKSLWKTVLGVTSRYSSILYNQFPEKYRARIGTLSQGTAAATVAFKVAQSMYIAYRTYGVASALAAGAGTVALPASIVVAVGALSYIAIARAAYAKRLEKEKEIILKSCIEIIKKAGPSKDVQGSIQKYGQDLNAANAQIVDDFVKQFHPDVVDWEAAKEAGEFCAEQMNDVANIAWRVIDQVGSLDDKMKAADDLYKRLLQENNYQDNIKQAFKSARYTEQEYAEAKARVEKHIKEATELQKLIVPPAEAASSSRAANIRNAPLPAAAAPLPAAAAPLPVETTNANNDQATNGRQQLLPSSASANYNPSEQSENYDEITIGSWVRAKNMQTIQTVFSPSYTNCLSKGKIGKVMDIKGEIASVKCSNNPVIIEAFRTDDLERTPTPSPPPFSGGKRKATRKMYKKRKSARKTRRN